MRSSFFGTSLHRRGFSVNEVYPQALPIPMRLGAEAMIAALLIGSALGIAGASGGGWRGQLGSRAVDAAALVGVVLPAS